MARPVCRRLPYRVEFGRSACFTGYSYGPPRTRRCTFNYTMEPMERAPNTTAVAKPAELQGVLQVTGVDMRSQENAVAHHTDSFEQVEDGDLVVRRGQYFDMTVKFNRRFQTDKDDLRLVFQTGKRATPGKGTYVRFLLSDRDEPKEWGAMITKWGQTSIDIRVFTPPDCIVAEWEFTVETVIQDKTSSRWRSYSYKHPDPVFILFNPWCKDDLVYFRDTKMLEEYVLNDSGMIFRGNYRQRGAKPWFFGQFENGILEAALYCIQKGFNFDPSPAMGDPIRVSRVISRIVNAQDDNGLLEGNWTGKYSGGTSPLSWSGSVKIIEEYMRYKEPVKFGQCFVFSGLVTTICRALGLPCRSVTNYASAHDSDGSVTIDIYWEINEEGESTPMDSCNTDSVWNFHVWNDVWMKRVDLPLGYGGWQAIDSTPQECSDGIFQCGPASLQAIKNGECTRLYEAPFIFAEVNADKVHWLQTEKGDWCTLGIEKSAVGRNISTKVPDGKPVITSLTDCESVRQDITNEYKFDDESDRARIAVICASRAAACQKPVYNKGDKDVNFSFLQKDYIMIGNPFDATLVFENNSKSARTVKTTLVCQSVMYTGATTDVVKKQTFSSKIEPGKRGEAKLLIATNDYKDKVTEQATMRLSIISRCAETGQVQAWQDDFRLRRPDLTIQVLGKEVQAGSPFQVSVKFQNPFKDKKLTECTLTVEGPGLGKPKGTTEKDVNPGATFQSVLTLTPKKHGLRQIIVTFDCKELNAVNGVADVFVEGTTV